MTDEFAPVSWEATFPPKSPLGSEPSTDHARKDSSSHQYATHDIDNTFESQDLSEPTTSDAAAKSAKRTEPSRDAIVINSTVSDPQKEQDGSQNAYISYLITTESNSPTFQSPLFRVRRRFSDFFFLFQMLYLEYPAVAVPPLPDKSRMEYIKGDRFGPEFTLKRAASLNRFLDRISHHPILKKTSIYLSFLESGDWNSYMRSLASRHQQVLQENGMLEGISDSLLNAFAKVSKQDDELLEVKERVVKLDDNLIQVEKAFTRVLRRQQDLSHDLEEFSQQLIKLAGLEGNLETDILAFASGTHNLSRGVATLKDQIDSDYIVSLKDMQNYVLSVKNLIRLREQKQLDFEALTDYLQKAKYEKNSIMSGGGSNFLLSKIEDVRGVNHEAARSERLQKVESKIESLTQEVASVKETSETFQEMTLNEIAIFENNKEMEMKKTLSALADSHIAFYQNVISQWEALL